MNGKLFVIALAGVLASCGSPEPLQSSGSLQVLPGNELPAPGAADLIGSSRPYLVGPLDKLQVEVYGIPDLQSRQVQVDASGRLSFPLAGAVEVAGKTPFEIERLIEQRLREAFIRNPQVTVNLVEAVSQRVTIDGEVKDPGLYPVVGRMTLMRAVAGAKGLTEFARLDDVIVFRTVGGKRMAAVYNMKAIRRGAYPDPEIYADDVVIVGDSPQRRMWKDLIAAAPLISTPLIIALQ